MAPSASTATMLLLLSFLVAAVTSPSRQTAHAARDVLQEAEAPLPGRPGCEDGTPGAAPAEAEEPFSELVREWELGFVPVEAPAAVSSSSAQAPAGPASSSARDGASVEEDVVVRRALLLPPGSWLKKSVLIHP
jgi:hypothetical protein